MEKFDRKALKLMQATAERYHRNLSPEVIDYLAGRGINRDVCDRFLLGVSDDIHEGWLTIPYLRPNGVVWFNYRRLDGGKPKYMASGARHLFNTQALDVADQAGEIAISEGELDAIVATAVYRVPTVGIPGATQWAGNRHWRELFVGYQRIWVLADPDEAGLGLAQAILEALPQARLVKLPGDVNECLLKDFDLKGAMR